MNSFSITVDIAAPPERVWVVMSDVERWAEWTASVTSVTRLDQGPLAPGSRARIRQPRVAPAVWTVIDVKPDRGFSWKTGNPLIWAVARHSIEPMPPGSRATLFLQFGGLFAPAVAWLTRSLNNRYLQMEAAGLKRRSEESPSPRPVEGAGRLG
jgi:uncharacterized protein YndB with AHSA1/START domain